MTPTADDYILAAEALYHYAGCLHRRVVCQAQQDDYERICARAQMFKEMATRLIKKEINDD